jgi:outer membrane protein TolC
MRWFYRGLFLFLAWVFLLPVVRAQEKDTLTLPACFRLATERYPLIAGKSVLQEEVVLEDENLKSAYYPQMNVGAQATYYSDVVTINLDPAIPGVAFPVPYHDQYAVTLDVRQTIYDGGAVKNRRAVKEQSLGLRQQDLEVKLYAFKQKLAHIFFSALFLDDNYAILQQNLEQMERSLAEAETALRHGVLLPGDVNILKAARLDIQQKMVVNRHDRRAVTRLLGMYLDTTFSDSVVLTVPSPVSPGAAALRPEMQMFSLQHSWLDASLQLQKVQRRPVISAFGQVGYGRPGLNPLNLDFKGFYFVGARLSWNLWDWNRSSREKKILSFEQQLVSHQEELFNRQVHADLVRLGEEVDKLEEIIALDKERVTLREGIVREYADKLAGGTITPAEYERQFTAWQNAQIQLNLHRKQLLEKQIEQLVTRGNLNDYEKKQ